MHKKPQPSQTPIRLGFVALADCAPLVFGQELGLFAKHGVAVELHREVGWATIRDKILYNELDAAQAPAGLIIAASCGFGSVQGDCLTGMVLNLHGNGITLSQELWKRGVRDGAGLRSAVLAARRPLVFAVPHAYAAHYFLLRMWLRSHGIDPAEDVRIVIVPPPQMPANLQAGHLDGYCVGEPWNSHATLAKIGWCATTSAELAPGHVEKVLMVRKQFAEHSEPQHLALIAALIESCRFCDRPENRARIVDFLSQSENVGAPVQALRTSLSGMFDYGNGRIEKIPDFHVFSRGNANEPTLDRASWVIRQLHACGLADPESVPGHRAAEWFRPDIYHSALQLVSNN